VFRKTGAGCGLARASNGQKRARESRISFEDFVGARQDRLRHRDTERFRRPQIHDQFEPGRLLHWQVCRFGSLQYLPGINSGLAISLGEARRVADQPALGYELAQIVYGRKAML
jgi:hypothetical protein